MTGTPRDPAAVRARVQLALRQYLDPLAGGDDGTGWPFGAPLRPSALLRVAQQAAGHDGEVASVAIALDDAASWEDCRDVADRAARTGRAGARRRHGPVQPRQRGRVRGRPAMSPQGTGEVWWGREAESRGQPVIVDGPGLAGSQPELLPASKEAVRAALQARIGGFTPDWTNPAPDDSGVALVRLFGIQMEPLLGRVNRLPEKALVEYLRIAGVTPLPATAAQALLTFTVAPAAGGSVLVPAGFQAGASPAAGAAGAGGARGPTVGGQVIFETERAVTATPATMSAVAVAVAGVVSAVDPALAGFTAFGPAPAPGNALWIGLALPPGVDSPAPSLSLALVPAATAGTPPPPVTAGGVPPPAAAPAPLVSWAILDGSAMVPATLLRDETGGLSSGGIVELGVPAQWRPGRPPGSVGLPELLWLRALLEYGEYPSPPVFSAVLLNVARAPASRTIYNEPLVMLPDSPDGLTQTQLSQTPVVPGSVQLDVDADPGGDVFGTEPGTTTRWKEVDSLGGYGPDAQVFTVDYATGVVTFGDGVHGARVPIGFRNVRATQYQTGGGSAGAVAANAVNAPLTSVGFVTAVSNPYPASGGTDTEPDSRAILRGAQELRTGGRAVTPADYGVLAVNAPGALVARAQGVAGLHPDYPGTPIPGVVGVLCVAPDTGTGLPPVPGEDDLQAVTVFLTAQAAPAGVLVAAAAAELPPGQDRGLAGARPRPGPGRPARCRRGRAGRLPAPAHRRRRGDRLALRRAAAARRPGPPPAARRRSAGRASAGRGAGRGPVPAVHRCPDPAEHAGVAGRPPAASGTGGRAMSCAPGPPTFRLLDHLVGWDPLDVYQLTDPDDPSGIQLAPVAGGRPARAMTSCRGCPTRGSRPAAAPAPGTWPRRGTGCCAGTPVPARSRLATGLAAGLRPRAGGTPARGRRPRPPAGRGHPGGGLPVAPGGRPAGRRSSPGPPPRWPWPRGESCCSPATAPPT